MNNSINNLPKNVKDIIEEYKYSNALHTAILLKGV